MNREITKVLGQPCSASDGKMNNSKGSPNGGKRTFGNGNADAKCFPSGAHETGVPLTAGTPKHSSPLGKSAPGCKGVEVNNNPGRHGSHI